jgi:putative tryptophan/tyrosine transport system substrate-binding protein
MRRREFIKLVGGSAVGWSLTASAQQSERIQNLAILMGLAENDPETRQRLAIFKNEMEKLGWSEGRNLRIEVRFAPAGAQASQLAKELIALQPDVILAHAAQIAGAFFQQT